MSVSAIRAPAVQARDADREQLLDRLQSLRSVLPVFAQELAGARRQAARLRVENGRLTEQVRRLQNERRAAKTVSKAA